MSMPYTVVYRSDVKVHVKDSKIWYRNQKVGLEKIFIAALKDGVVRIQNNPEAFAVRYRNVRIAHTYRFPFSIHFYIEKGNQRIVITNIIHDYRDAEY